MIKWPFGRKAAPDPKAKVLRLTRLPAAIYAIGDVHGCLSLLQQLEQEIAENGAVVPGPKLLVCLGDVVDRGPQSAAVLDHLLAPAPSGFQRVVLQGNHESMMEQFLDPAQRNMRWLSYGGDATLASYGLSPETEGGFGDDGSALDHKLKSAIPPEHRRFLAGLPCGLEIGRYRFAHAGYDLGTPAENQHKDRLIWGPPENSDNYRGDQILIHGHVPTNDIAYGNTRINIDLGSYSTGRLAAIRIDPETGETKEFIVSNAAPIRGHGTEQQDASE